MQAESRIRGKNTHKISHLEVTLGMYIMVYCRDMHDNAGCLYTVAHCMHAKVKFACIQLATTDINLHAWLQQETFSYIAIEHQILILLNHCRYQTLMEAA